MFYKFSFNSNTNDYAPCTGLSTFEQDIASVGEDGRINLLTAGQKQPVRVIGIIEFYSIIFYFYSIYFVYCFQK